MKTSISIVAIAILALVASTALAASPSKADQASQLIGAQATSSKGETLGTVNDLVIGADGRLSYLVIAKSDMSGLVALPYDAATPRVTRNGQVEVAISKEKFDRAPTFASNNWPDLSSHPTHDTARGYRSEKGIDSEMTIVNGIPTLNPYPF